jgi:hypothetical protein
MARGHELKQNMTDAAVWSAIRYLDPDLKTSRGEDHGTREVIYASLIIFILGCLGLVLFCGRMR